MISTAAIVFYKKPGKLLTMSKQPFITHDQLYEKVLKAMGGTVPLGFREDFSKWHEAQGTELWLRYDWIKHHGFYTWLIDEPAVDWHEGGEGITFWICKFGGVGHEKK